MKKFDPLKIEQMITFHPKNKQNKGKKKDDTYIIYSTGQYKHKQKKQKKHIHTHVKTQKNIQSKNKKKTTNMENDRKKLWNC